MSDCVYEIYNITVLNYWTLHMYLIFSLWILMAWKCTFHTQIAYSRLPIQDSFPFLPYERKPNYPWMAIHLVKIIRVSTFPGRQKCPCDPSSDWRDKSRCLSVETSRKVSIFLIGIENMSMMHSNRKAIYNYKDKSNVFLPQKYTPEKKPGALMISWHLCTSHRLSTSRPLVIWEK